jgi:polyhydroxybutyrate depolymerase
MENPKKLAIRTALFVVGISAGTFFVTVALFYAAFYGSPRANGTLVSSGQEREYLLHVPAGYDPTTPAPLVISLHGAALWPATQMEISRWNEVADDRGFIVVYPSGRTLGGGGIGVRPKVWHSGEATATDVRFILDLIGSLQENYNIDATRIYANGFSNGGRMAFDLSCRLPHLIAAIGTVAAAQDQPWESCPDTLPIPLISFHGTADPLVSYEGRGPSLLSPRPFPSVLEWTEHWARRNQCRLEPNESMTAGVTRREYTDCAHDASVVLYTVLEGGHTWPGGKPMPEWLLGTTTTSIDATRAMWAFFSKHKLRRRE